MSNCNKCKQTGPSPKQFFLIFVGFYILFAAVYGTFEILKKISTLF